MPKNVVDLGKLIGAKGVKSNPKCKKLPNLVTLTLCLAYEMSKLLQRHCMKDNNQIYSPVTFAASMRPMANITNLLNNLNL